MLVPGRTASPCKRTLTALAMRRVACERDDESPRRTLVQSRRTSASGARDSPRSAHRRRRTLLDNPVSRTEGCRRDTCNLGVAKARAGTKAVCDATPTRDLPQERTASRRTPVARSGLCIQAQWMACARTANNSNGRQNCCVRQHRYSRQFCRVPTGFVPHGCWF